MTHMPNLEEVLIKGLMAEDALAFPNAKTLPSRQYYEDKAREIIKILGPTIKELEKQKTELLAILDRAHPIIKVYYQSGVGGYLLAKQVLEEVEPILTKAGFRI